MRETAMNLQETVQLQLGFWHNTLESMLNDCGDVLGASVGGTTNTIAATYAHMLFAEDGIVNGMLAGKPLIYVGGGWQEKTGVPHPGSPALPVGWEINMKLEPWREYAKAVYANTDAYLSQLTDTEVERKMQGPVGETTVGWMVGALLATHYPGHAGEIAAMKGVHGLKGLPF
jgi:hypothetical protein